MSDYFPRIQDKLRLHGYPLAKQSAHLDAPSAQAHAGRCTRWQLHDAETSKRIVVSDNFFAFETNAYAGFDEFVSHVSFALEIIAGEVKQLCIERVGLRYVDLLREREGESWIDFVHPGIRGFESEHFLLASQTQLHQTLANTKSGTMIVRLFQNRDGLALPPDLVDGLKPRLVAELVPRELLTILDVDHFSVHTRDYDKGWLEEQAWTLHDELDQVFRKNLVTPIALEAWT